MRNNQHRRNPTRPTMLHNESSFCNLPDISNSSDTYEQMQSSRLQRSKLDESHQSVSTMNNGLSNQHQPLFKSKPAFHDYIISANQPSGRESQMEIQQPRSNNHMMNELNVGGDIAGRHQQQHQQNKQNEKQMPFVSEYDDTNSDIAGGQKQKQQEPLQNQQQQQLSITQKNQITQPSQFQAQPQHHRSMNHVSNAETNKYVPRANNSNQRTTQQQIFIEDQVIVPTGNSASLTPKHHQQQQQHQLLQRHRAPIDHSQSLPARIDQPSVQARPTRLHLKNGSPEPQQRNISESKQPQMQAAGSQERRSQQRTMDEQMKRTDNSEAPGAWMTANAIKDTVLKHGEFGGRAYQLAEAESVGVPETVHIDINLSTRSRRRSAAQQQALSLSHSFFCSRDQKLKYAAIDQRQATNIIKGWHTQLMEIQKKGVFVPGTITKIMLVDVSGEDGWRNPTVLMRSKRVDLFIASLFENINSTCDFWKQVIDNKQLHTQIKQMRLVLKVQIQQFVTSDTEAQQVYRVYWKKQSGYKCYRYTNARPLNSTSSIDSRVLSELFEKRLSNLNESQIDSLINKMRYRMLASHMDIYRKLLSTLNLDEKSTGTNIDFTGPNYAALRSAVDDNNAGHSNIVPLHNNMDQMDSRIMVLPFDLSEFDVQNQLSHKQHMIMQYILDQSSSSASSQQRDPNNTLDNSSHEFQNQNMKKFGQFFMDLTDDKSKIADQSAKNIVIQQHNTYDKVIKEKIRLTQQQIFYFPEERQALNNCYKACENTKCLIELSLQRTISNINLKFEVTKMFCDFVWKQREQNAVLLQIGYYQYEQIQVEQMMVAPKRLSNTFGKRSGSLEQRQRHASMTSQRDETSLNRSPVNFQPYKKHAYTQNYNQPRISEPQLQDQNTTEQHHEQQSPSNNQNTIENGFMGGPQHEQPGAAQLPLQIHGQQQQQQPQQELRNTASYWPSPTRAGVPTNTNHEQFTGQSNANNILIDINSFDLSPQSLPKNQIDSIIRNLEVRQNFQNKLIELYKQFSVELEHANAGPQSTTPRRSNVNNNEAQKEDQIVVNQIVNEENREGDGGEFAPQQTERALLGAEYSQSLEGTQTRSKEPTTRSRVATEILGFNNDVIEKENKINSSEGYTQKNREPHSVVIEAGQRVQFSNGSKMSIVQQNKGPVRQTQTQLNRYMDQVSSSGKVIFDIDKNPHNFKLTQQNKQLNSEQLIQLDQQQSQIYSHQRDNVNFIGVIDDAAKQQSSPPKNRLEPATFEIANLNNIFDSSQHFNPKAYAISKQDKAVGKSQSEEKKEHGKARDQTNLPTKRNSDGNSSVGFKSPRSGDEVSSRSSYHSESSDDSKKNINTIIQKKVDQQRRQNIQLLTLSSQKTQNLTLLDMQKSVAFQLQKKLQTDIRSQNEQKPEVKAKVELTKKKHKPCQEVLADFINHWCIQLIMLFVTIYALFGDDVRLIAFEASADIVFFWLNVTTFSFFTLELYLSSMCISEYFGSFFFWLDLISTVSVMMDVQMAYGTIWDANYSHLSCQQASIDVEQLEQRNQYQSLNFESSVQTLFQTRNGKLTRIVRLIRLIRIAKIYKSAEQLQKRERARQIISELVRKGEVEDPDKLTHAITQRVIEQDKKQSTMKLEIMANEGRESNVGKRLTDFTLRKMILIIFIMLFMNPLFQLETYMQKNNGLKYGLNLLVKLRNNKKFEQTFNEIVEMQQLTDDQPLIGLCAKLPGQTTGLSWKSTEVDYASQRLIESITVIPDELPDGHVFFAVYNSRFLIQLGAILGICQTVTVCIILGFSSYFFSRITNQLVINPIENMIERVNHITMDPLCAMHDEEERLLIQELENQDGEGNDDIKLHMQKNAHEHHHHTHAHEHTHAKSSHLHSKDNTLLETDLLEQTLYKIGALMAIGYGEAGSQIIVQNMGHSDIINPMMPGEKIISIFGFCDIRKFTNATEVLREGVMIFVNEIGHICHGIVDRFSGAANKNVGDAFLFVWKLEKEDMFTDHNNVLQVRENSRVSQIADMSVISFLLLISGLKKSTRMVKYNKHNGLNKLMPNYEVKLGMGLHMGYSIEGPLGSYYKIDPTYLSPHVKMAERLESSTKVFGVPLLISEPLYIHLSKNTKNYCRQVDYVIFKGQDLPIRLYTVDVFSEKLALYEKDIEYMSFKEKKIKRIQDRMKRNHLREQAFRGIFQISSFFESNQELKEMTEPFNEIFRNSYHQAFDLYQKGQWNEAKKQFKSTIDLLKQTTVQYKDGGINDPLSQLHIEFMQSYNFTPPCDWKGYKDFDE